jgi:F0F1-type ATP synthase membrane subunit b/b'
MSPFSISVFHCELERKGNTISKQQIESANRANQRESRLRERVARILRHARAEREKAHQQADEIIQSAQEKAQDLESTWKAQAEQQAVEDSLTWLVKQSDIESQLIDGAREKIRQQVRGVVEQWAVEQDVSQFLIKRLTDQVCQQAKQQNLSVKVSREKFAEIEASLGDRVTVKVDPNLQDTQAELESKSLVVRIDLKQQLDLLLNSFSHDELPNEMVSVGVRL